MDYCSARIHPTARIAESAVVVGDVEVGERCTVLWNAVLRGDCSGRIVVGKNTNIQENACVHVNQGGQTVIGSNVTVGHGAIVHGCTIGNGSLVGMGAVVIDGARVGKHCLVGAGALVTGTADIPDGMLVVGQPARAVRPLTPDVADRTGRICAGIPARGRRTGRTGPARLRGPGRIGRRRRGAPCLFARPETLAHAGWQTRRPSTQPRRTATRVQLAFSLPGPPMRNRPGLGTCG